MKVCYTGLWIALITVISIDAMLWDRDVLSSIQPSVSDGVPTELTAASDSSFCTDRHGNLVADGAVFIPGDDACRKCHCSQGAAAMCTLVHCSAPPCVLWEPIPDECCQFHCIETSLGSPYDPRGSGMHDRNLTIIPISKEVDAASLGIRLAASAISSLLIVVLLLFMVQRLRRRRLLITMRRIYNENRSSDDFVAYSTSVDQTDSGFDFPSHEEPPPPYSSMNKPVDEEPPPSYDQINEEVPGDTVVSGGQGEVASSSSGDGQGSVGHESHHNRDTHLGTAQKQRATKFWPVDRINDVNSCSAESIELRDMKATSNSTAASNAGDLCEGTSSRVRPSRKKCGKCRHSADANVTRDHNQLARPRSLQVSGLSDEVQADCLDAFQSESIGTRKSAKKSSGNIRNAGEILGEQQFKKRSRSKQQVCSNAMINVGHNVSSLKDESAADGRNEDSTLCFAPVEAFADGGTKRPRKKFQISAEYRGAYRPVSCDLADIEQQQQLHSDVLCDNWFFKSRRSHQLHNSHNLPNASRRESSLLKRERSKTIAVAVVKNESRRRSRVVEGDFDATVASTSKQSTECSSSSRLDHNATNVDFHCNGMSSSNSNGSVSSICAETGEKKTRSLLSRQSLQSGPLLRSSAIKSENVNVCAAAEPNSARSLQIVATAGQVESGPGPEVRYDHNSTSPKMSENEISLVNGCRHHRVIDHSTDLYRKLGIHENKTADRAGDNAKQQTLIYKHTIDRILEQIEAAQRQFGWQRHVVSSIQGSEVCSNWRHRYQRRSLASCKEDLCEAAEIGVVLSNIPKTNTAGDVEILDWINSNVDLQSE